MDDQARDPAEVEREIQRNADWADYLRRIDDELRVAEEHLSVPPGAISGIQNEPEYLFIVKVFAALEPIINELLAARLTFARKINMQALLGELSGEAATPEKLPEIVAPMPLGGRPGKLELCAALGCLTRRQQRYVSAVARVRNRYAHNIRNMHLSIHEIVRKLARDEPSRVQLYTDLIGSETKAQAELVFALLGKQMIYVNMANFLADALQIIKPPPYTGHLAGLFGLGQAVGDLGPGLLGSFSDRPELPGEAAAGRAQG